MSYIRPASLGPALVLLIATESSAVTIYVPGDYATIREGLMAAMSGDVVEVACGTYSENDVQLVSGVTLRSASGLPGCVTIDGQGQGRVLLGSDLATTTVLAGLTVTGGVAAGPWPQSVGGALFVEDGSPQVIDCVFSQNTGGHGGAVGFLSQCSPQFRNCVFRENVATGTGGAVNYWSTDDPSMIECSFVSNSATRGGAILAGGQSLRLHACTFEGNAAVSEGGAVSASYVATYISRSTFTANCVTADEGSGGGGAMYLHNDSPAVIEDCLVQDNTAWDRGGGIAWFFCPAGTLRNCRIVNNRALNGDGGGTRLHAAHVTIENSVFWGNTASHYGGALFAHGSFLDIHSSTHVANQASLGGWYSGTSTNVKVNRSIIAFSTGGASGACDETVFLTCTDVFGNLGGDWTYCIAGEAGVNGNMTLDPLFCDAASGDFGLRADSPCAPPGVTGCGLLGALPVTCGTVFVEPRSWGSMKALYR
jgi:predicted outer membrane repeat protein